MAKLTLNYVDLYTRVSSFMSLTTAGVVPTGTNLTTCKDLVDRGIRQFLYPMDMKYGTPHEWSFLKQHWSFSTVNEQWKYSLPVDFSDLLTGFTHDNSQALPTLKKVDGQQIKEMRSYTVTSGWPYFYAVVPQKYDIEIGTTYELWLYPNPSQKFTFSAFYRPDPVKLAATTDLMIGGIMAIEAILESCLAVAETQEEDNTSTHHQQEAARLIQTAIRFDSNKADTETIGNLYAGNTLGLDSNVGGGKCTRFAYVDQSDIYSQG